VKLATHLQVNAGVMNKSNYNSNPPYALTAYAVRQLQPPFPLLQ